MHGIQDDPFFCSWQCHTTALTDIPTYKPPPDFIFGDGIRDTAKRHDALARKRYCKPFKWFKFNRARKATAK